MLTRFVHMCHLATGKDKLTRKGLSPEIPLQRLSLDMAVKVNWHLLQSFHSPYYSPVVFFHLSSFSIFLDYRGRI